jgi:hypothetical protein
MYAERCNITKINNIKTKGKIIQNLRDSFSKTTFSKKLELIKEIVGDLPVITHSNFTSSFKNGTEGIYFFNCSGYNELTGKDIAVVGTPSIPHPVVMLMAAAAGIPNGPGDRLELQDVIWEGKRFKFVTYSNSELRAIHLGQIQGELEQAIGRARHLRTTATVWLFSSFPISGAIWENRALTEIKIKFSRTLNYFCEFYISQDLYITV